MNYGLIGEHLGHSFSKIIHEMAIDHEYDIVEIAPEELDSFMKTADFKGINVTIPYKQDVIPYLHEISDQAKKIGAVNTIVNKDGRLIGHNTDYAGMRDLFALAGINPAGKKVLILGTGGTSKTAYAVTEDLGAREIYKVSRSGRDGAITYDEACTDHKDTDIIVNTTPSGMFPHVEGQPLSLDSFEKLSGLIDVIYNPLRTNLVLEAQKRGIPAMGGLYMLVAQAIYAEELFCGLSHDKGLIDRIYHQLLLDSRNIVLSGMSMAGKTTVGHLLSEKLGKKLVDTDQEIIAREKRTINEIFATDGESYFRDIESLVTKDLGKEKGLIIALGGGAILREENVQALKRNGLIFFLDRPLEQILPADDRPLANTAEKVRDLYTCRYPIYKSVCDIRVINEVSPEQAAEQVVILAKES